ncbi:hypothetical protein T492DRAFT_850903 [Pavlovales sp. CCMP2436]|nr:hypothetical protein T492DRAFT_850903 [Pavlovales sp. CCMP2436]
MVITLRELCVRRLVGSLELLSAQPASSRWLEYLPPGTVDEIVDALSAAGRWDDLPWPAVRLLLAGGPRHLDLSRQTAMEDVAFRAAAQRSVGGALRELWAGPWISDETALALLRETNLERLHLRGRFHLRLPATPARRGSLRSLEPLSLHLRELDVSLSCVTDTAMRKLLCLLPNLRVLRASETRLSPLAFAATGGSGRRLVGNSEQPLLLETLELRACCAGFLHELSSLARRLPRLEWLDLSDAMPPAQHSALHTRATTSRELASALSQWAPTMRVLRLRGLTNLLDQASLACELPCLCELDVSVCAGADEALGALNAPSLTRLYVGGGEASRTGERAILAMMAAQAHGGVSPAALRTLELHLAEGALEHLLAGPDSKLTSSPAARVPSCALVFLTLVECGVLADATCTALAASCRNLTSLELRCVGRQAPSLHLGSDAARRLLRQLSRVVLERAANEPELFLDLPAAEHVELQLGSAVQSFRIDAPRLITLVLRSLEEHFPTDELGIGERQALSGKGLKRPFSQVMAAQGSKDRGVSVTLDAPSLEALALLDCEASVAVLLALAAVRPAAGKLRSLCMHECMLGERDLACLIAPLSDAAMRALRVCRISGTSLPLESSMARDVYRRGALRDCVSLMRTGSPVTPASGAGGWAHYT